MLDSCRNLWPALIEIRALRTSTLEATRPTCPTESPRAFSTRTVWLMDAERQVHYDYPCGSTRIVAHKVTHKLCNRTIGSTPNEKILSSKSNDSPAHDRGHVAWGKYVESECVTSECVAAYGHLGWSAVTHSLVTHCVTHCVTQCPTQIEDANRKRIAFE